MPLFQKPLFRLLGSVGVVAVVGMSIYAVGIHQNWYGRSMDPGRVSAPPERKHEVVEERQGKQLQAKKAVGADSSNGADKQILFGDLHVHTSLSTDAYFSTLPLMQGDGVHPPADACDFARYCSSLDFWSINDHAESITPRRWMETKETIRQCNATAGDPANPDMVSYLGWEWTQTAADSETQYGHKNVIFIDTDEDKVPSRPIAAMGPPLKTIHSAKTGAKKFLLPLLDFGNRQQYYDFETFLRETPTPFCPEGVDVRDLPDTCIEYTKTPAELFAKLKQWGFPTMVIPHGNTVGHHTAAGSTWMNQLTSGNHDPQLQNMIEVYSGHGNSEEYRDYQDYAEDEDGNAYCPEPTESYTAMCWRAGEIINERCLAAGESEQECGQRAVVTRQYAVEAGHLNFAVIGGSEVAEWLEAGECTDCFQPASGLRPNTSVQAALAVRNFKAGPGESERFKFALMASSDNHTARAGTGFKEVGRHNAADISGPKAEWLSRIISGMGEPLTSPVAIDGHSADASVRFTERSRSFVYTGGLIATHSVGRDRQSIWDAMQRKEVYGTSGPRILLWFNLLDEQKGEQAMGSDLEMSTTPRFRVRAVGAFKQKPGCPDYAINGLTSERLENLCYGECYNPGDERHRISRIEVVKITPQVTPDEKLGDLIEDTWKVFECNDQGQGCSVEFDDPGFAEDARDSLYYVRAIQEPTPTINGANLRCEYDENGQCIKVNPCYIDERTDYADDCLAPSEHRAWSSPIFVDYRKKG